MTLSIFVFFCKLSRHFAAGSVLNLQIRRPHNRQGAVLADRAREKKCHWTDQKSTTPESLQLKLNKNCHHKLNSLIFGLKWPCGFLFHISNMPTQYAMLWANLSVHSHLYIYVKSSSSEHGNQQMKTHCPGECFDTRKLLSYLSDEPAWLSHQCQGGDKLPTFIMETFRDVLFGIDTHVRDLRQCSIHLAEHTHTDTHIFV